MKIVTGAVVGWLGILVANVGMTVLYERVTIGEVVRHLLDDWPFLIYFYLLMLVSLLIYDFLVGRRSRKR